MKTNNKSIPQNTIQLNTVFYIFLAVSLFIRILFAAFFEGFKTDVGCFGGWALRVYEGGFANFYSPEVFSDYPPGYMYVLYIIGALLHTFRIEILSPMGLLLIKLPSIITDLSAGCLLYYAGLKYISPKSALILCGAYLFNPAVLLNSVIWGQIDSVLTLFIIVLCLLCMEGRTVTACFTFVFGLLLKPQMLVFAPILLYALYEFEILHFTNWPKFFLHAAGGILSLLTFAAAMLPFGPEKVINQYTSTLGSYPYASVNAYNFWAFLGLNWTSQEHTFLGISYRTIGVFVLVLLTVTSAVIFEVLRRQNQKCRYALTGAFLMLTTFTFSVRMHERYLYPAMLLLLFACIFTNKMQLFQAYIVLSIAHFFNVWHVLYYYDPEAYSEIKQAIVLLSAFMLFAAAYFYYVLYKLLFKNTPGTSLENAFESSKAAKLFGPKKPACSLPSHKLTKYDRIIMAVITVTYAVIAFTNLGYNKAPQTEYAWALNDTISLQFDINNPPQVMCYYLKYEEELTFQMEYSCDDVSWSEPLSQSVKNVFSWGQIDLGYSISQLRLTNTEAYGTLGELIFLNKEGAPVTPLNASDYALLFDEADTLPETFDFRSQSYFDEIYYTRTIHEFREGLPSYENTHPPLGKIIIMLGTYLFGMNPFGFRFMGTLFGVLMLPFLYLLARNLLGNRIVSAMVTLCFAFDFMHFTQTRITTIDVFIVFFIILMYFFMEKYLRFSFYDSSLKKTFLPLGACGIAFGLGIACKWTGFYAGAGLAVLFFASLYKRFQEYRYACMHPNGDSNGISHGHIRTSFLPNTLKTVAFCVLFFVCIPAVIYILSYIPFRSYREGNLLQRMWENQLTMYHYHSTLTATHPYASPWYQWPAMVRPVFYYAKQLGNDMYQGISALGNPLVWFAAIPAVLYTLYHAFIKHKFSAFFLAAGFLSLLLPWTLVNRCTFLYHYFPCIPFLALMIGYAAMNLKQKILPKYFYTLCAIYTLAVLVLFILFYPVISGMPVSGSYVDTFLRWRDSWVLILN